MLKNRVRELRARDRLTQDELAKAVGVSRQTIVALEKESYVPSLVLALHIAHHFQCEIEEIFTLLADKQEEEV
ncbi:transcriptional regulator [Lactococcus hodotermopsidis]|uniref:Transcriptional regulator n=1 Tax=Pseudolactococcus hodotermopsidis TaxID=2709157 RepID=A0A6A0BA49_9LACT|nr:helix-turn-helix transcriptional regulator [Lactococcus hodotermopsidis]GFH42262.1 transcriptional regulator [Lactococcus hodotermopsidis]